MHFPMIAVASVEILPDGLTSLLPIPQVVMVCQNPSGEGTTRAKLVCLQEYILYTFVLRKHGVSGLRASSWGKLLLGSGFSTYEG